MKHNGYYPPVGSTNYGMMGPFNKKKKKKKRIVSGEGPFGTIFVTEQPTVNDSIVVKKPKRRG